MASFSLQESLSEWGISREAVDADQGAKAGEQLSRAVEACGDSSIDPKDRIDIATAIMAWALKAPDTVREDPLIACIPGFFLVIETILLAPDDDPAAGMVAPTKKELTAPTPLDEEALKEMALKDRTAAKKAFKDEDRAYKADLKHDEKAAAAFKKAVEARTYAKAGLQIIPQLLVKTLNTVTTACAPVGCAAWGPVCTVLENCSEVDAQKPTSFLQEGPAVTRFETLEKLFNVGPKYGVDTEVPSNILAVVQLYARPDGGHAKHAIILLNMAQRVDPTLLEGKMWVVFRLLRADSTLEFTALLTANVNKNYLQSSKVDYEANLDLLLAMDFSKVSDVLRGMANNGSASALAAAGVGELLLGMCEAGCIKQGLDYIAFDIIATCAGADATKFVPLVDRYYSKALTTPRCDVALANFLSNVGKGAHLNAAQDAALLLCKLLSEPALSEHAPPTVLGALVNLLPLLLENTDILTPHMAAVEAHRTKSSLLVERVVDWHEGRSLAKTDARLDELEAKVNAMNADFKHQCNSFEEVSALMDEKIADVKDFVGEIVKKLPQPCKLEVVGGVRKTLLLHFACARTGETVTTESTDWHQWCKVGFGLMKLGKCVAFAAAGNPMALTGGVGAIKDIYKGYKTKDDADFTTFISQPFLTSAESDKLILQLRAGKFFEKMEYNAQVGDWVLMGTLTDDEAAKRVEKRGQAAATKANVSHTKGVNFGLGSVKDGLSLASELVSMGGEVVEAAGLDPGAITQVQAEVVQVQEKYGELVSAGAEVGGVAVGAVKKRGWFGSSKKTPVPPAPAPVATPAPIKNPLAPSPPPPTPTPTAAPTAAPQIKGAQHQPTRTTTPQAPSSSYFSSSSSNNTKALEARVASLEVALREQAAQQVALLGKLERQEKRVEAAEEAAARLASASNEAVAAAAAAQEELSRARGQAHRIAILESRMERLLNDQAVPAAAVGTCCDGAEGAGSI